MQALVTMAPHAMEQGGDSVFSSGLLTSEGSPSSNSWSEAMTVHGIKVTLRFLHGSSTFPICPEKFKLIFKKSGRGVQSPIFI